MTGTRTTMVLWLNALLTQQRLSAQQLAGTPPLDFNEPNPVVSDQVSIWRTIVSTNWTDIFKPAVDSLTDCGNMSPSATSRVLRLLKQAVERIETANLGLQLNVGAELFPKLSDDRKESAAFYTQPSIAELLSALTIRRDDLSDEDWSAASLFSQRKIADLACGTGTLLRAGFQRVSAMHEESGGTPTNRRANPQRRDGKRHHRHRHQPHCGTPDHVVARCSWARRSIWFHPRSVGSALVTARAGPDLLSTW